MASLMANVQNLGRTLMLPIAVLPVAGLLLRFGQPDLFDIPFIAASGAAIFSNLGLLFAIGVAVGFAKDNNGAAGLAGAVCYFVATQGARTLIAVPPEVLSAVDETARALAEAAWLDREIGKLGVPVGIVAGIASGVLYNRYHDIRLPEFLAFFGGRRFVPIAAGCFGVVLAAIVGLGWIGIEGAMDAFSRAVVASGEIGVFIYGVLNRILIVTGLHHILNNVAWFIVGDFGGVTGDLNRFFAGDPEAGRFMAGFFPVMMFGLPAACLAMYHAAPKDRRAEVGGMYLSLGLTSLLTGVTEPIEFTFMFLAPVLYGIHAVLTGLSMVIMDVLNVKIGFGFSAGLIDYVLNFNLSTRPLLLLPVGLVYGLLYYGMFRFCIARFNLKTPGRDTAVVTAPGRGQQTSTGQTGRAGQSGQTALGFIEALGGAGNLASVDACMTRLRLVLNDPAAVDEARLKSLGAKGFIRPSATTMQVVLGPVADQVASEIRAALGGYTVVEQGKVPAPRPGQPDAVPLEVLGPVLAALGGIENVRSLRTLASRIRLSVQDRSMIDRGGLESLGLRGMVDNGDGSVHLIFGPQATAIGQALSGLVEKRKSHEA
ncbi:N-acetylglucosamine-specific PTS transporter subunit IIBC [Aquisalinus flavus]|uniref:PTS N-acetylglucosamine transporter subunit IIABC n=1 Tax=Aquisalinus flavus TaxID=1526572 RepID=A0A8J2V1L1_9PROT|nr:N-acetylglucosamine-specific PTS transporter subunit IIBC [Aquisalinus flavus]MBD0427407.1 PTS transporter subunit EIIC [Aquisalinus flavus]UNE47210.1 PTS N-acetyl-D-glucosamine transporter [Aquisalinus flavus]GGD00739.1 PTS N-acetylglucosamine transporter subunit IIABC [Aquisalinus flavus]